MKGRMCDVFKSIVLLVLFSVLLFSPMEPVWADLGDWYDAGWVDSLAVTLTETAGVARVFEPVDIFFEPKPGRCVNATKEIRVVAPDNSEVPSQVYNITMESGYVKSCNVVFLANVSASSSTTYHIYYNAAVEAPVYDGLRLYTEEAGNSYNVTAVKNGVEKMYFRIYWKHMISLYSDGKNITLAGGAAGWELFTISFANLWADAEGIPWFSTRVGETLEVVDSGPLFVDFENVQPISSDLWAKVFNSNISSVYQIRVYYQPDMNPLVRYRMSLTWNDVETVNNPLFMDFKLANDTSTEVQPGVWEEGSYAIYRDFTWKDTNGVVQTVPVETSVADLIWSPENPVGWWSYNGSRSDSTMKPGANIGLVPTYIGGTMSGPDYTLNITQQIETNDHHCSPWITGTYNGIAGDMIETTGYIVTHTPTDQNIAPTMEEKATKLRNPLTYSLELPPPVGGIIVPVNKLELLMPYIGLISVILATVAIIFLKYRKKQ